MIIDDIKNSIRYSVWYSTWGSVNNSIHDSVRNYVRNCVPDSSRWSAEAVVFNTVQVSIGDGVKQNVFGKANDRIQILNENDDN